MKHIHFNLQYLFILALLFLPFCSIEQTGYYVEVRHDRYDNFSKFTLDGNYIPNPLSTICFDVQTFVQNGQISHSIIIDYFADDWIFIEPGVSLKILADDNKIELYSKGSSNSREVSNGGKIRERAYYDITLDDYQKLLSSNNVEFKLSGNQYYVERKLTKKNKENLKRFYDEYMINQDLKNNPQNIKGKGMNPITKTSIVSSILIISLLIYVLI
jgi:hypothetical protein